MGKKGCDTKEHCSCCSVLLNACCGCIKPITRANLRHHYLPLGGNICYTTLSLQILKPTIMRTILPTKDPTNLLLAGSLAGMSSYVYNSKHLRKLSKNQKFGYSIFASGLFNLGSLLMWAMIKSATKEKRFTHLKVVLALGSAWILAKAAKNYLHLIDDQIPDEITVGESGDAPISSIKNTLPPQQSK